MTRWTKSILLSAKLSEKPSILTVTRKCRAVILRILKLGPMSESGHERPIYDVRAMSD